MTQPAEQPGVSTGMGPLEIARSRLLDIAQGASPELFDQLSAVRVHNYLSDLEKRHQALTQLVDQLPGVLSRIQIQGPVPAVIMVARVLDDIADERESRS